MQHYYEGGIISLNKSAEYLGIKEGTAFVAPTSEQRKNLKEMICIEIEEVSEDADSN